MKVLVLENTLPFGKALRKVLKDGRRHNVLLAQGLSSIEGQVVAQTHDGRNMPLDLAEFDFVLVDGNVPKGLVASDEVVKRLTEQGVFCVASSALPKANELLTAAGAKLAVCKHALICGLAAKLIKKTELTMDSPVVQERLTGLDQVVKGNEHIRHLGESIVMHYLSQVAA